MIHNIMPYSARYEISIFSLAELQQELHKHKEWHQYGALVRMNFLTFKDLLKDAFDKKLDHVIGCRELDNRIILYGFLVEFYCTIPYGEYQVCICDMADVQISFHDGEDS